MRLLLLVALILAGCAAPANPPPAKPAVNAKPVRERPMRAPKPAPAPAEVQQETEPQQMEMLEPPRIVKGWLDISGNKRDDAALYQDSSACRIVHKQAVNEALQMYPEALPDKECGDCGTHNARAARIRQQNIRNHADAAYVGCMESKGWRRK